MGKTLSSEIVDRIKSLSEEGLSIRIIVETISEEFNKNITPYYCSMALQGKFDNTEEVLHELNDEVASVSRYEIKEEGEHIYYLLTHQSLKKTFKLKVSLVDDIFKSYSRHGLNLSGEEILQRYKLKPEVFSLIKNKLRLFKSSDVISEYSKENLSEEELDEKIEEAIDENINRSKEKLVNTHARQFKKKARKAMQIAGNFEYRLDELKSVISNYAPKTIKFNQVPKSNNQVLNLVITDLHIGKKHTDRIIEDLEKIKTDVINASQSEINVFCLGDIAENLSQNLMHPGQHINLDDTITKSPFDLMIHIADIFQNFLIDLRKHKAKVSFIGLTGNHDRVTAKNEDDIFRTAGLTIYEFMKQGLKNTDIRTNYCRETINQITLGNKHFILSHGEYGFNKKKPEDILWKYGRQDMFNIMISGHTHQHVQQVGSNYAKIVVAPLAGPNDFDERLGLKGEVGYTKIIENCIGGIEIQNVILK